MNAGSCCAFSPTNKFFAVSCVPLMVLLQPGHGKCSGSSSDRETAVLSDRLPFCFSTECLFLLSALASVCAIPVFAVGIRRISL